MIKNEVRERLRRRERQQRMTFTKRAVKWLLILGAINGTAPFILSAFEKDPVAEIGIAWITEIVAVTLGYLLKAYFETKSEKKQDLENYKAVMRYEDDADNDSVG